MSKKILSLILIIPLLISTTSSYAKPNVYSMQNQKYNFLTTQSQYDYLKDIINNNKPSSTISNNIVSINYYEDNLIMNLFDNITEVVEFATINELITLTYKTKNNERITIIYDNMGGVQISKYDLVTDSLEVVDNKNMNLMEYSNVSEGELYEMSSELQEKIDKLLENNELEKINDLEGIEVIKHNGYNIIQEKDCSPIELKSTINNSLKQEVTDEFSPYTKRNIYSTNKDINYFDESREVRVYKSMDNYQKVKYNLTNFLAGTALTVVSAFLTKDITIVYLILTGAGILVTGKTAYDTIKEYIGVTKDAQYRYSGRREGYIYDTTIYNDYVKVYNNNHNGEIDGGYDNSGIWHWIESPQSDAFDEYKLSNDTIVTKTAQFYNECLHLYGYCNMYEPSDY